MRFLPIVQNPFMYQTLSGWPDGVPPTALSGESGVHSTDLWTFFCYPIRGHYNDYGTIEDVPAKTDRDRAELAQFIHLFREHTVPLALGENEYHDPATTDLNLERILNCLSEGRIWFKNQGTIIPVGWMMIKEHVWKSLLKLDLTKVDPHWDYRVKKGDAKVTVASMKLAYDKDAELNAASTGDARFLLALRRRRSEAFHQPLYESPITIDALSEHHSHLTQIASELDYVATMLGYLRISLAPTIGSGSQSDNLDTWRTVTKAWITAETAAEKRRMRD